MRYLLSDTRFAAALLLVVLACTRVPAQDVENFFSDISTRISEGDILNVSGRANANLGFNAFDDRGSGARPRNQPFNWGATAALNLDILGIQAPFSAAFSNRNSLYNLPSYSFVGISPSYKWITLHAGDRSMNFSPYSLNGINFTGGGFELKPKKFYLAAMSGRLRRARIQDIRSIQNLETTYRRNGRGVQAGYDNEKGSSAKLSVFSSSDRADDEVTEFDSLLVDTPEKNLVLTLSGAHQFSTFLSVEAEWAQSVLTRDDRAPELNDAGNGLRMFGLFTPKTTTTSSNAVSGRVVLSPKFGKVNIGYERIDPEYRTHGSLFFQNDLENFTAGLSAPLFDGKLSLSTNVGIQRNDLDNRQASSSNRFIGAANLGYQFSDRVNSSVSFSNFTSTNRYKAIAYENFAVDSIVLAQTQLSADLTTTVLLGAEMNHVLLATLNWQRAGLIRDEVLDTSQTSYFGMAMLTYAYQPKEAKSSFNATLLVHRNDTPDLLITTFGPSVGYSRQLLNDQLSVNVNLGYTASVTELSAGLGGASDGGGGILQAGIGSSLKLGEHQSFNLNLSLIDAAGDAARPGYTDFQLGAGYGYQF